MVYRIDENIETVQKNDVIILQCQSEDIEISLCEYAKKIFQEVFPNQTIIVLPKNFEIQIIRKKDY